MLTHELVAEAQRQFQVCNACRYCEGVCNVFPALERLTQFEESDILHLANLCHECRACYYVCPYAPPHELAVNIPPLMAEIRQETYASFSWPSRVFRVLAFRPSAIVLAIGGSLVLALATLLGRNGLAAVLVTRTGPGSFYELVPWLWMFVPAMVLSLYAAGVYLAGAARYWRWTRIQPSIGGPTSFWQALVDVLRLRSMTGGGPGCNYPDEQPSHVRRTMHGLVFYGFISAFIATTIAFGYQDILGILPPYEMTSAPVLFGSAGGIAMIIGCSGLLLLKFRGDWRLSLRSVVTMDVAFLVVLMLTNVSGMLLLFFRGTPAMGLLLGIHLGFVLAFFVTLPYGKFVHGLYRSLSLVRDRGEREREA